MKSAGARRTVAFVVDKSHDFDASERVFSCVDVTARRASRIDRWE